MHYVYDVVAVGEILIDFTPAGISPNGAPLFEANPGGAPANVACAAAKLGCRAGFIGKAGRDTFGELLKKALSASGVDISGLVMTQEYGTTLAFVHLDASGERSFSFYRKEGADRQLTTSDIRHEILTRTRLLHFGSVSLTHEPARTATLQAVNIARKAGALVSFDPNLRPLLWDHLDDARQWILEGMTMADIVKLSEEELFFLAGRKDIPTALDQLQSQFGTGMIFVTMGKNGCYYKAGESYGVSGAYDVSTIDTTGAGDAFFGAALHMLLQCGKRPCDFSNTEMQLVACYANAAGSLATMRKGAIPSLPTIAEIEKCMKNRKQISV